MSDYFDEAEPNFNFWDGDDIIKLPENPTDPVPDPCFSIKASNPDCFSVSSSEDACFYIKQGDDTENELPNEPIDLSDYGVEIIYGIHANSFNDLWVACQITTGTLDSAYAIAQFTFVSAIGGGISKMKSLNWAVEMPTEIPSPPSQGQFNVFSMHGSSAQSPLAIRATGIGEGGDSYRDVYFIDSNGVYLRKITQDAGDIMCNWASDSLYIIGTELIGTDSMCPNNPIAYDLYRPLVVDVYTGVTSTLDEVRSPPVGEPTIVGTQREMGVMWTDLYNSRSLSKHTQPLAGTHNDFTLIKLSEFYCTHPDDNNHYIGVGTDGVKGLDQIEVGVGVIKEVLYDGWFVGFHYATVEDFTDVPTTAKFKQVFELNDERVFQTIDTVPHDRNATIGGFVYMYSFDTTFIKQVPISSIL